MQKPNVTILSNCTHASIATGLRFLDACNSITSYQMFSMTQAEKNSLLDALSQTDLILTAVHGEKYGPLSTKALKNQFPQKVLSFAVPFFSGLHPEFCYVSHGTQHIANNALAGEYQFAMAIDLLKRGIDVQDIRKIISGEELWGYINIRKAWDLSVSALLEREKETELKFAEFVASEAKKTQCFYSFNHPSEKVITQIIREFLRAAGLKTVVRGLPTAFHDLLNGAFLPVADAVADSLNLQYRTPQVVRSPVKDGGNLIDVSQARQKSFDFLLRYMDENELSPSDLNISSPAYFRQYVKIA